MDNKTEFKRNLASRFYLSQSIFRSLQWTQSRNCLECDDFRAPIKRATVLDRLQIPTVPSFPLVFGNICTSDADKVEAEHEIPAACIRRPWSHHFTKFCLYRPELLTNFSVLGNRVLRFYLVFACKKNNAYISGVTGSLLWCTIKMWQRSTHGQRGQMFTEMSAFNKSEWKW